MYYFSSTIKLFLLFSNLIPTHHNMFKNFNNNLIIFNIVYILSIILKMILFTLLVSKSNWWSSTWYYSRNEDRYLHKITFSKRSHLKSTNLNYQQTFSIILIFNTIIIWSFSYTVKAFVVTHQNDKKFHNFQRGFQQRL